MHNKTQRTDKETDKETDKPDAKNLCCAREHSLQFFVQFFWRENVLYFVVMGDQHTGTWRHSRIGEKRKSDVTAGPDSAASTRSQAIGIV